MTMSEDPTRTKTLRERWVREVNRRYRELKGRINSYELETTGREYVPNADGAPNAKVVVFQDSSERVWARDAFQKRGAKTSGLRRGWAFSGTAGQWLCRGHAAVVTSERREEDGVAGRFAGRDLPDFQLTKLEKPKLEAESACASPRRPSRESERVAPAKLDLSAFSVPELSAAAAAAYGHGESSPERGARATFNASSVSASPPFKSLSDACRHLLLDAGPLGLQVSTLVHEIQKRKLAKLGGKTPNNSVAARLRSDARFVNVALSVFALAKLKDSSPHLFSSRAALDWVQEAYLGDGNGVFVPGDGEGDVEFLTESAFLKPLKASDGYKAGVQFKVSSMRAAMSPPGSLYSDVYNCLQNECKFSTWVSLPVGASTGVSRKVATFLKSFLYKVRKLADADVNAINAAADAAAAEKKKKAKKARKAKKRAR